MRYVDEFRDPLLAKRVLAAIRQKIAATDHSSARPLKIMEVCGGHTHAIFKFGIGELLPDAIELVHGPGCPVCVLPAGRVDDAIAIASSPGVIFCTFGDAMRVPGSTRSLQDAKAEGCDVRTVYSPADALALARREPERPVVFFGLGFETTAPSTALTVLEAARDGVENFFVFANHVTIIEPLEALLTAPEVEIDGFIGPGHVTMVIGLEPYAFIAERFGKPFVVSGFEPLDVLQSVLLVLEQVVAGEPAVVNQYRRVVQSGGNPVALRAMAEVYERRDSFEWRGLGSIPRSGLRLREPYARFDAERHFATPGAQVADHPLCECGAVLTGAVKPWECKVFGTACTPETPIGACMVSAEGACAAWYNYGRLHTVSKAGR